VNHTIANAIHNMHVLSVTYKGIPRLVEPHAYGISTAGNDVLRCYQTAGGHVKPGHEWDLLTVSKMAALADTQQKFSGPRPGYRRGDSVMTTIYAQL
jgi:hypothetical protein